MNQIQLQGRLFHAAGHAWGRRSSDIAELKQLLVAFVGTVSWDKV